MGQRIPLTLLVTVLMATTLVVDPAPPRVEALTSPLCDKWSTTRYSDVRRQDYGADYIHCMKVLLLYRASKYRPDSKLTRQDMANFVRRLWTYPRPGLKEACPVKLNIRWKMVIPFALDPVDSETGRLKFAPVPYSDIRGYWNKRSVDCIWRLRITKAAGISEGKYFSPGSPVSEQQLARILYRVASLANMADAYDRNRNIVRSGICFFSYKPIKEQIDCLHNARVIPEDEGMSARYATRAQAAVYLISLWRFLTEGRSTTYPPSR